MNQHTAEVAATEPTLETDGLPEGWAACRMGDIADIVGGGTPIASDDSNFSSTGHAWMTPADLSGFEGVYIEKGRRDLSDKGLTSSSAKLMPAGTVLMSSRAPIGYVAIAANTICTNQGFRSFVCHGDIHPEYVFYWLKHMKPVIQGMGSGSTFTEISGSRCKQIPFDFPPLAEQKRIVAQVDAVLARVNGAREHLVRVPGILKRFRQSVLTAACSGQLTADWREKQSDIEPAESIIRRIRDSAGEIRTRRGVPDHVAPSKEASELDLPSIWAIESTAALLRSKVLIDVKDGNHGANHPKKGEFSADGLPFITAAQVNDYRIDYEGAPKVFGEPLHRLRVGFAEIGDAVLTHKGTVGRAATNTEECVLTPQTTYYRCNTDVLDPKWLVYFFTSFYFYRQLAAVMSQTTRDFVPISEQYLLFLFVPPLAEQLEIVRRIEALFALADRIEQRAKVAAERVEKTTQSILARAFRAELVETEAELARREGREYESALQLLARIQTEREKNASAKPKRRSRTRRYTQ